MVKIRQIRQIDGTYYIKLFNSDLDDFDLKVNDDIVIDEIHKHRSELDFEKDAIKFGQELGVSVALSE